MRRIHRPSVVAVLLVLALLANCSKKSSAPTSPQATGPACSPMRRIHRPSVVAVLLVLALLANCSKKSSAPTSPQATGPACSLSATSLAFGDVLVGASADRQFSLTNAGGGTLSGTVTDTSAAYGIVGGASFSLVANQAATFTVRFTPAHAGVRNCSLQLGTGCNVACSGTGTVPPILDCEVTPTTIDFGTVTLGQVVDRTFTLKNLSNVTMAGSIGGTTTAFSVPGSTSYSLAPGQTATFIVRFTSDQPGPFSATIQTGQPGCPTVTCSAIAQEVCALSTTSLDFGLVASGSVTKKSFTITNVGFAVMTGVVGTDGTCAGFGVEGAPVNFNLAPGQSIPITVDFAPSGEEGVFGCTVLVLGNGVSCPSVTCSGVAQFPCNCVVGPTSIDFGDAIVGGQYARQFTISTGGETAIGGVMTVIGSGFELSPQANPGIVSTSLAYTVGAGTSQVFNLIFTPQVLGPTSAVIAITQTLCTRIGSPCDTVHCTGNGITNPPPPSCAVSTTNLSFGTLHANQVKDTTFTVTNTGGGTMNGSLFFVGSSFPFSFVGSTAYSLGAGRSKSFTVHFFAPPVEPGHTVSYVGMIDLGTPCEGLGLLTLQGVAVP